jgi:hypothetical protein
MSTIIVDHAISYADRGLSVLPLHRPLEDKDTFSCSCGKSNCSSPAKHPVAHLAPAGVHSATTDPYLIRDWFDYPWNLGIATGAKSGIVVLDIDPRHQGDESLADLERRHGRLPDTRRFRTGGGGEHILFRHSGAIVPNSAGKIASGIDIRGENGYIVAPPSRHISGGWYSIPDNLAHGPADIPSWLLALIKVKEARVERSSRSIDVPGAWNEPKNIRIRSALKCIPADNRDDWLRVGMALHWTGWGDQARFLWDDWSRTSPKFDQAGQESAWRGFGDSSRAGLVTLGTVFHLAKQNGWRGLWDKEIARAAGILLARGIDPHACLDLIMEFSTQHCNPPVSDEVVAATVAYITRRDLEKTSRHEVGGHRGF